MTTNPQAHSKRCEPNYRPIFRDARGNEWNGKGVMPDWLLAAKHAGLNPEFFRIEAAPEEPAGRAELDLRQMDLLA